MANTRTSHFSFFIIACCFYLPQTHQQRLRVKNMVRNPCSKRGSTSEPIVLPQSDDTVLLPNENDDGCYTISGPIMVKKHIGGSIQIYVEMKYGTMTSIAPCHGANEDNCGGVGSCVFCDSCGGRTDPNMASVQLQLIGRQFDCKQGLNPGNYTDLGVSFCLPTLDELLKAEGISKEKWYRLYKENGQTIYQTFYIFNEPINLLNRFHLQNAIRTKRNLIGCDIVVTDVTTPD